MELIFEIRDAEEGGFCARALGHAIFTEADTWEALRSNVLEAVSLHFEDAPGRPPLVQMHYVKVGEILKLKHAIVYFHPLSWPDTGPCPTPLRSRLGNVVSDCGILHGF